MSIEFTTIYYPEGHPLEYCTDYKQIKITREEDFKLFQQLISRAVNVWDRAPPHIKEFADKVIHGEPLQDYYAQEGITKQE